MSDSKRTPGDQQSENTPVTFRGVSLDQVHDLLDMFDRVVDEQTRNASEVEKDLLELEVTVACTRTACEYTLATDHLRKLFTPESLAMMRQFLETTT